MHLEKFAKELDINFKNTFDENSIDQIINLVKENKTPINNLDLPDAFGVYVFFLKREINFNTFQELETIWNEEGINKIPKAIKSRFDKCKSENGFYPFYVGKSELISKRINEHLNHHKTHSTYGMKLKTRNNFKIKDFYIGHWCIENMSSISPEVKQFIITTIEQKVRKVLNPLIGKKIINHALRFSFLFTLVKFNATRKNSIWNYLFTTTNHNNWLDSCFYLGLHSFK